MNNIMIIVVGILGVVFFVALIKNKYEDWKQEQDEIKFYQQHLDAGIEMVIPDHLQGKLKD